MTKELTERRQTDLALSEMSHTVGWLRAKQEEADRVRDQLQKTLEDTADKIDKVADTLAQLKPVVEIVRDMKTKVDDHERLKQRGLGLLIGTGLAGGATGAGIAHLFSKGAKLLGGG